MFFFSLSISMVLREDLGLMFIPDKDKVKGA